jgi:cytochrome c oxidase cbb3-type subunit 1
MHPFYIIRALGGALFLAGALIMCWNVYRTIVMPAEKERTAVGGALAAAE